MPVAQNGDGEDENCNKDETDGFMQVWRGRPARVSPLATPKLT